jgi:uncharacterized coiled-coil protein SlyX
MKMIEIVALENGAHRNQIFKGALPDGWAVIPDGVITVNFPFGEVEAEEINGVMTVTKWTPGTMPEPEPIPDPEPTIDDRVTELEEQLAATDETAIELYEAMAAQEEINTAQDDALIELYEMIGG